MRRIKYELVFILLLMVLFLSCHNTKKYKKYEIPFQQSFKDGVPLVEAEINNQKFTFAIDTGSEESILLLSGIEKMFGTFEKYENKKRKLLKNYEENENYKSNLVITIPSIKMKDFVLKNTLVKCYELNASGNENFDGIIGLPKLHELNNIIIDYKNKKIFFDGEILTTDNILGVKFNSEYKLLLPVRLNYNEQYAIFDTGLSTDNYKYILINNKMNAKPLFKINEAVYGDANVYDVDLKIGNVINEKVWGIRSCEIKDSNSFTFGNKVLNYVGDKNIIGNAVFADHIIQIDFGNMEFRIQ